MSSQFTDQELQLINAVLGEVESTSNDNDGATQQQVSNEQFVKSMAALAKYIRSKYANKNSSQDELESYMMNVFNFIQQQLQAIVMSAETVDIKLKAAQLLLRLPVELWRTVFNHSVSHPENVCVYPEWFMNEMSKSYHELITDPKENIQAITRFVKAYNALIKLFVTATGSSSFSSISILYFLHDEYLKMVNTINAMDTDAYESLKSASNEQFISWLGYLTSNVVISLANTDHDGIEANSLVFICKSIVETCKNTKNSKILNEAWKALMSLTCSRPSHISLIKRFSNDKSSSMNVPHMFLEFISEKIRIQLATCLQIVQNEVISPPECDKCLKLVRFYVEKFSTVVTNYGEDLVVSDREVLWTVLLSCSKFAYLLPVSYSEARKQSDIDDQIMQILRPHGDQIAKKTLGTLKTIMSVKDKDIALQFINHSFSDLKDPLDVSIQIYFLAFVLSKEALNEDIQWKLFSCIFEQMAFAHPVFLRHTETSASTISLYSIIDNYLSMFYDSCHQKSGLTTKIQSYLWVVVFDPSKTALTRQLAIDSISFYFAMNAQRNPSACSNWIQICDSIIDSTVNNIFVNSEIDDYDWLIWKEATQPLLEKLATIVIDSHQFLPSNLSDRQQIFQCAVLPSSLLHSYFSIRSDFALDLCDKCGDGLRRELSEKMYQVGDNNLLAYLMLVSACYSFADHVNHTDFDSLNNIANLILSIRSESKITSNYRIIVEMINCLAAIVPACGQLDCNSDTHSQYDTTVTNVLEWLTGLVEGNSVYKAASSFFISKLAIKNPSSDLTTKLEQFVQRMLILPSPELGSMGWMQFQTTLESIYQLGKNSDRGLQLKKMFPSEGGQFVISFIGAKEMDYHDKSIFNTQDNSTTKREDLVGQKRKREYKEFENRQAKRMRMAGTNMSSLDEATKTLQELMAQMTTMSAEEKKLLIEQIQPLAILGQQVLSQLKMTNSRNTRLS